MEIFRDASRIYLTDYSRFTGFQLSDPAELKHDLIRAYTETQTQLQELEPDLDERRLDGYLVGNALIAMGLFAFGEFHRHIDILSVLELLQTKLS
jgi:hypothetical protein